MAFSRTGELIAFINATTARDLNLNKHLNNVMELSTQIALVLRLPNESLEVVRRAALFHDIGKIKIAHEILYKTGALSSGEWEQLKLHPTQGSDLLEQRFKKAKLPGLDQVISAVRHHHEAYDGSGYPGRLCGREIPLASRIIAIADSYDAMTTSRPYRKAVSGSEAIKEIIRCAGTQFDPKLVAAFIRIF